MAIYSIGTAVKYDTLPLLPIVDTNFGGVRLNANIVMNVGDYIQFDWAKANDATWTSYRVWCDSIDALTPRFTASIKVSSNQFVDNSAMFGVVADNPNVPANYESRRFTKITSSSNLGAIYMLGNTTLFMRGKTGSTFVKRVSGETVVWKWLDQISDYKSTPPNATIGGYLTWYKKYSDGTEITNYASQSLLIGAVPNPAGAIVEILDRNEPVDLLIAGGYTVRYTYVSNPQITNNANYQYSYKWSY